MLKKTIIVALTAALLTGCTIPEHHKIAVEHMLEQSMPASMTTVGIQAGHNALLGIAVHNAIQCRAEVTQGAVRQQITRNIPVPNQRAFFTASLAAHRESGKWILDTLELQDTTAPETIQALITVCRESLLNPVPPAPPTEEQLIDAKWAAAAKASHDKNHLQ